MEDNIKKLIAVVLDKTHNGLGANCIVYIIEHYNNIKIIDLDQIKNIFPNGNVFSGKIFNPTQTQIQVGDLIEIPLTENPSQSDEEKSTYILHNNIKKIGIKIIDIPINYTNKGYLDIDTINEYYKSNLLETDVLGKFYLSDSQYLFGPFKIEKSIIIPVIGKSVFKYDFKIDELIDVVV